MNIVKTLVAYCLMLACNNLNAGSLAYSFGTGLDDTLIQSDNISSTSAQGLLFSSLLTEDVSLIGLTFDLHLEVATFHLNGRHENLDEVMDTYHIKPKLRWQYDSDLHFDIGLGLGYITNDVWEEIHFSGQVMFALSFATGIIFGQDNQFSLDLVYNHYSNGYTRSPNPGLDIITLNIGYNFN